MGLTADIERLVEASGPDSGSAADVFAEIGWEYRQVPTSAGQLLSLIAGEVPQVLVVLKEDRSDRAVSLGYSHEAALTLMWGDENVRLFETGQWSHHPGDSPVATAPADEPDRIAELIFSLGRDRYRSIRGVRRPGHEPLPELLALAFGRLRQAVAQQHAWGPGPTHLGPDPFVVFHQLLFARIHEDRHPSSAPRRIAAVLTSDSPTESLAELLDWYASTFDSELFGQPAHVSRLPEADLRNLLETITEPWRQLKIDFSVSADDLAGRLYQSYLRLTPVADDNGRLFPQVFLSNKQRQGGAYYTPAPLAEYVTSQTLGRWLIQQQPSTAAEVRVIDPACGSGAFLAIAFRLLIEYFSGRAGRRLDRTERSHLLTSSIFGVDTDREAMVLARLRLLELADLGVDRLPSLADNLVEGDALVRSATILEAGHYDVVLMNPPFASPHQTAVLHDLLAAIDAYPSAHGTGRNIAAAFGDLAFSLLRDGGRAGLIMPRAILDGDSGAWFRDVNGAVVEAITDFGNAALFAGVGSYAAAIVLRSPTGQGRVSMSLVETQHPPVEVFDLLHRAALDPNVAGFVRVETDAEALSRVSSWAPFVHRWQELARHIHAATKQVGTIGAPEVVIGTQLGDQSRFVFPEEQLTRNDRGFVVRGVALREEFVPRWAPGSSIDPFRFSSSLRVVVPRMGEDLAVDEAITALGGVPTSFRPGDLQALRRPKVVVRNMFLEPSAYADLDGSLMPPQGGNGATALVGRKDQVWLLAAEALLNSALYQWLLRGLAHPKANQYRQLMKHQWSFVPWPELDQGAFQGLARRGEAVKEALQRQPPTRVSKYWLRRAELDEHVFDMLGVAEPLRRIVSTELRRDA